MSFRPLVSARVVALSLATLSLSACETGDRGIQPHHDIQVSDGVAHVPNCPDWSDAKLNAGEGMAANFGCATSSNLAAMIADPNDLVRGKVSPGIDAAATVRALKVYRELVPTGTKEIEKVKAAGSGSSGGTP